MGRAESFETAGPQPRHVAIIMDGNGRWATRRGLPRLEGHRRGVDSVREIVEACPDFGVEYLTLFAFSSENWKRSTEEVSGLMGLFRRYFRKEAANLVERGARVKFIGERSGLDKDIQGMMASLEAQSALNDKLTIIIALNYGGRSEIARAAQKLAADVASGEKTLDEVTETALGAALDAPDVPDPDLVIRTSGEARISNFLLWQSAYAELYFTPLYWPDFDRSAVLEAIDSFTQRQRRFGGRNDDAIESTT